MTVEVKDKDVCLGKEEKVRGGRKEGRRKGGCRERGEKALKKRNSVKNK